MDGHTLTSGPRFNTAICYQRVSLCAFFACGSAFLRGLTHPMVYVLIYLDGLSTLDGKNGIGWGGCGFSSLSIWKDNLTSGTCESLKMVKEHVKSPHVTKQQNLFLSSVNCYRAFPLDAVGEASVYSEHCHQFAGDLNFSGPGPCQIEMTSFQFILRRGYRGTP